MNALSRLALAVVLLSLPAVASAQPSTMSPGPTVGPMPGAPPERGDYPDPTDISWGNLDGNPCRPPFPPALCDDLSGHIPQNSDPREGETPDGEDGGESGGETDEHGGGLTGAASRVGEEMEDLAERNPVAGFIMWVAETLGPNVPTGDTVSEASGEATMDDIEGQVYDLGGLPAVRSFAQFVDPVKSGGVLLARNTRPRARVILHSRWEFHAQDNDEYVVRVHVGTNRRELPVWVVAQSGRLFAIVADQE